jgi:glycosyltransferase involved in cell wall biosynthesis
MINVLALVPYPPDCAPGQRYRIEQWIPYLQAYGVRVTLSPFFSAGGMGALYKPGHALLKTRETLRGYFKRVAESLCSSAADAFFVYREAALLGPAWIERLFANRRPLVFDFDDAIYLRHTSAVNAWSRRFKSRGKAARICRMASHVTVGNDFLANFATQHARRVTVIPSTIDTDVYKVEPRRRNPVPVIGWTGSPTTLPYLMMVAPALRRLREKREFELRVIGAAADIDGIAVRCLPWRPETEPDDLRRVDIGLMPVSDDEWSRGKCGMKALQYMALGIPPVVSPIGVNASIVHDGVNGLHARTEDEWVDRMALLLDDASYRETLGGEARRTVAESYSARIHAPRMAKIFIEATK